MLKRIGIASLEVGVMADKSEAILEQESVHTLIWKMAIPSIIGIMSYNLYNILDTIWIAKGVGTLAAGAISITSPLFFLLSAVSTTLGSGAGSVISRALGEEDTEKTAKATANTFVVFYLIAIVVTIVGLIYLEKLLYGLGATKVLMPYAKDYARITLIGCVTSTAFSGLIRAQGNSRYAMYVWLLPMVINIILDPLCIFFLQMGVTGAAVSNLIAQIISVIMSVYFFFFSNKSLIQIKLRHIRLNGKILKEIILTGLPSFIQLFGYSITILIVNRILKEYAGETAISTYAIVTKINMFLIIPINGLVQGIQPIIGYSYGARRKDRVRNVLKTASFFTSIYAAMAIFLVFLAAIYMMQLFTFDQQVIDLGQHILKIISIGIGFTGLQSIQTVFFQAIGKIKITMFLSFCNSFICFVPSVMIGVYFFGVNGVWYSFLISTMLTLSISSLCMACHFRKGKNETRTNS